MDNLINRRSAIQMASGLLVAGAANPLYATATQHAQQQAQQAMRNPAGRTLTVVEQPEAELEEMRRLQGVVNDAAIRAQQYEQGLREKYRASVGSATPDGHDHLVEVEFSEGYVFIRDHRAAAAAKEAAYAAECSKYPVPPRDWR